MPFLAPDFYFDTYYFFDVGKLMGLFDKAFRLAGGTALAAAFTIVGTFAHFFASPCLIIQYIVIKLKYKHNFLLPV